MLLYIAYGLAVGTSVYLLVSLIKIVRTCTKAVDLAIEEFRLERQMLNIQKQIVSSINSQIGLQKMLMDKQLTMAINSIQVMRMLHDREQDPQWMQKFEEGRDNAKYN